MYMNRLTIQVSGETGRTDNYCAAIRGAGGEPVAGYCSAPDLRCHGLLLCGGQVQPLLYGGTGSLSAQQEMPDFLPDRLEAVKAVSEGYTSFSGIGGDMDGRVRFVWRTQAVEVRD